MSERAPRANKRRGAGRLSQGLAKPRRLPWFLATPAAPHVRADAAPGAYVDLHTFQTVEAFDELRRTGVLEGSSRYWMEDFAEAYRWMKREMDRRLPTSGDGMVWMWAATTRRELLASARRARGDVLVSVRLPRKHVLLSHFDDWHHVLNRTLHIPGDRDVPWPDWEARFDRSWDDWSERTRGCEEIPLDSWPEPLREELERSWQAIFDPATWVESYDGASWVPARYLQATAHRITLDEVTRAVRLL
ncbi:DUF3841 domain-containing protein [Nocardioides luteus]|uniref:DUF3841 domain-containing protein n=1 Tax=Nocardioides luteus TaxID=1844 RepID=UPI0018CBEBBD|nr:DUF3841 domain-containing protein [Nocardioides luteus]MBG6096536.1 hypothetical protein [Nocardioides luteus]